MTVIRTQYNRWRVLRSSHPALKRPSDTGPRARVVVRCVCGEEQVAWLDDITSERSTGCRSKKCRARFEVQQALAKQRARFTSVADVLDFVDAWVAEGRVRDEQVAIRRIEEEEERQARRQEGGRAS